MQIISVLTIIKLITGNLLTGYFYRNNRLVWLSIVYQCYITRLHVYLLDKHFSKTFDGKI